MKSIDCTWDNIRDSINYITGISNKYDLVIGVNRGGLPISTFISNVLKLPHGVVSISTYDNENKISGLKFDTSLSVADQRYKIDDQGKYKVLLVDELSDSGKSLVIARLILKDLGYKESNIDIFTVYYKEKSIVRPTYFFCRVPDDVWINFPWEKI